MTKIFHINYFPNPSSCFSDLELGLLLGGLGWPRARLCLTMDLSHIGMGKYSQHSHVLSPLDAIN